MSTSSMRGAGSGPGSGVDLASGAGPAGALEARGVTVPPPISAAQRSILYAIRRRGEVTVGQLADSTAMTVSGARQHLAALADVGLVESSEGPRRPGQRGRSELRYRLSPAAEPLFPKAYGELTNQLLGYLPGQAVAAVFDQRSADRVEAAHDRLAAHDTFEGRVAELARILDEDGYLASFERADDDLFLVTEHNCAILTVARAHPHACTSEIDFIRRSLPDAIVERVTHMASGEHSCTYEIRPRHRDRIASSPAPS
jgi:DeoR family suf operon transcriptional repressor